MKNNKEKIEVTIFKMPFRTNHFNKNQRVWVRLTTGDMAVFVTGKYRGKGRYISAWVKYKEDSIPKFQAFEIDKNFAERHKLI